MTTAGPMDLDWGFDQEEADEGCKGRLCTGKKCGLPTYWSNV